MYRLNEDQWGCYYPNDLVIQIYCNECEDIYFSVKLDKPINQYRDEQIKKIGRFIYDVRGLIIKNKKLDWTHQFKNDWVKRG